MKDECNGTPIQSAVALRSKMYSLLYAKTKVKRAAKGIPYSYQRNHLSHQIYKDCLFNRKVTLTSFHCIRSKNHKLETQQIQKIGLSAYDNKRFVRSDGINTYALGHFKALEELKSRKS